MIGNAGGFIGTDEVSGITARSVVGADEPSVGTSRCFVGADELFMVAAN